MAFKRRSTKKRVFKKRSFKRKSSRRPSVAVKKMVRREIARNVETKHRQSDILDAPFYYPAQGALYDSANTLAISPSSTNLAIVQGTSDGTRIGNKIKLKKLTFKGIWVANGYSAAANPIPEPMQVKLVLFYDKTAPTAIPAPRSDYFQFNSTVLPFQGDLTDLLGPANADKYRVLATKTFKLGFQQYFGTGNQPNQQQFSNNDFKLNKNIIWDVTKYCVSDIRYNDNSPTPTTRGLFMQVIVSPAGGQVGSAGVVPCSAQWWTEAAYEDA